MPKREKWQEHFCASHIATFFANKDRNFTKSLWSDGDDIRGWILSFIVLKD